MFNSSKLQIGLDLEGLSQQVQEMRIAKIKRRERENVIAEMVRKQAQIALQNEQRENANISEIRSRLENNEFPKESFNFKTNHNIKSYNKSSLQKLGDLDDDHIHRLHKQKSELRDCLLQQVQERAHRNIFHNDSEKALIYDVLQRDKEAYGLALSHNKVRKQQCILLQNDNIRLASNQRGEAMAQKMLEWKVDRNDMNTQVETWKEAKGPYRGYPDRWKGLGPKQRNEYNEALLQQIQENEKRRKKQIAVKNAWDQWIQQQSALGQFLDEQEKQTFHEQQKVLDAENQRLAVIQHYQKRYLE